MSSKDENGGGARAANAASPELQRLYADFQRRAKGMNAAERRVELDRLLDGIVDRAAAVAPPALRAKVREQLAEMVRNDPTLRLMAEDVHRTAKP